MELSGRVKKRDGNREIYQIQETWQKFSEAHSIHDAKICSILRFTMLSLDFTTEYFDQQKVYKSCGLKSIKCNRKCYKNIWKKNET